MTCRGDPCGKLGRGSQRYNLSFFLFFVILRATIRVVTRGPFETSCSRPVSSTSTTEPGRCFPTVMKKKGTIELETMRSESITEAVQVLPIPRAMPGLLNHSKWKSYRTNRNDIKHSLQKFISGDLVITVTSICVGEG